MEKNYTAAPVSLQKKEQFPGIDILKFIMAFFVVGIHFPLFPADQAPVFDTANFLLGKCLFRLAVPFYFAASGFLLFKKFDPAQPDPELIRSYCFRMLRLLGIWLFLLFLGGTWHLWYVKACVMAVIAVGLCFYWKLRFSVIVCLALGLYAVGLLGDSYYGLLEAMRTVGVVDLAAKAYEWFFDHTRNGLFMGFIFVLMGAYFARTSALPSGRTSLLGFLLSAAMLVLEAFALEAKGYCKGYNMYISLLPATFFLFALALKIKPKGIRGEKLRIMGLLIYFLHMFCAELAHVGFTVIRKICGADLSPFRFPATAMLSLAAAWGIMVLSRKHKWLTYLYK